MNIMKLTIKEDFNSEKSEIKCFDFGSIKRELRPHLRTIIVDKFQYIDLILLMGKHDDFIKISYCIFKVHKPFIKVFYVK